MRALPSLLGEAARRRAAAAPQGVRRAADRRRRHAPASGATSRSPASSRRRGDGRTWSTGSRSISMHEAQLISQDVGLRGTPFTHVPHGVDAGRFADASPDAFREHAGLGDEPFVLCVGAIDVAQEPGRCWPRRCAARASRSCCSARRSSRTRWSWSSGSAATTSCTSTACRRSSSPRPTTPPSVHVLPSWAEGAALANLEAAAAGCPLVVSDRSSEFEYFGDLVALLQPGRPGDDPRGVEASSTLASARPSGSRSSSERMRDLTWEKTARRRSAPTSSRCATARSRRACGCRARARAATAPNRQRRDGCRPVRRRSRAAPPAFTDGLPWVRQPILDFVQDVADAIPPARACSTSERAQAPYRELFEHADYVTNDWTHSVHPGRAGGRHRRAGARPARRRRVVRRRRS